MLNLTNFMRSFLAILLLGAPNAALACSEYLEGARFSENEHIFVGRLIDYEVFERGDGRVGKWAILTYIVDEALRGEFGSKVEVVYNGSMYGYAPQKLTVPSKEIVQVFPNENAGERPTLIVSGCGYKINLAATPKNIGLANDAISRGTQDVIDFEPGEIGIVSIIDRGWKRQVVLAILLGLSAIIALVVLIVIWWRRRKAT